MSEKVAILHQGFIPIYRVKFFELLNKQCDALRYIIFHGNPPTATAHYQVRGKLCFPNIMIKNFELCLRRHSIIYQSAIAKILFGSYRAVILGHELKFVSNLLLFLLCKLIRKPVIWWGHGFEKQQDKNSNIKFFSHAVEIIKCFLARSADMFIVYTEYGAKSLRQLGILENKIVVVRNTIDVEEQCLWYEKYAGSDPIEIRKKLICS